MHNDTPQKNESHNLITDICYRYGFELSKPIPETESADYDACRFNLQGKAVIFRSAKITPTKTGQFVTIWKRTGNGPIQPFDSSDPFELYIISVRTPANAGLFIFPAAALVKKDILSHHHQGGKRGIRVYPPWDETVSPQAKKTQQWQLHYFLDHSPGSPGDPAKAAALIAGS